MTPMAIAGVIWVPGEANIGYDPENYAAELEIFGASLTETFGQDDVQFLFAQPTTSLVEGITDPNIPGAKSLTFDAWPKSLQDMAIEMGKLAE